MDAIYSKYHVLATAKDPEILSLFKFTLNLSHKHLEMVKDFFKSENIDLPNGFTENDVHLNAPALFTDNFWLIYIHDIPYMVYPDTLFLLVIPPEKMSETIFINAILIQWIFIINQLKFY